ncbi:hypothetical protein ACFL2Q_11870 [Thermodesulfobacteriota bacterium]
MSRRQTIYWAKGFRSRITRGYHLMSLFSYFQNRKALAQYKRLRNAGRHLNEVLVERLPDASVLDCAKKLGLLKAGSLVLNSEQEMPILLDYCLYADRRDGKTVIERYSVRNPPPDASDEMILLQAMKNSHYSVFEAKSIHLRQGATLLDMLRDEEFLLMDVGIGSTGRSGMFFAGRVLPLEQYFLTSGALIPLSADFFMREVMPALKKYWPSTQPEQPIVLSPTQEAAFSAQIIRAALRKGQVEMVAYK